MLYSTYFKVEIERNTYLEIRKCSEKLHLNNTKPVLRRKTRLKPRADFDKAKEIDRFHNTFDFHINRHHNNFKNRAKNHELEGLSSVSFFVNGMVKLTPNDLKSTKRIFSDICQGSHTQVQFTEAEMMQKIRRNNFDPISLSRWLSHLGRSCKLSGSSKVPTLLSATMILLPAM